MTDSLAFTVALTVEIKFLRFSVDVASISMIKYVCLFFNSLLFLYTTPQATLALHLLSCLNKGLL